MDDFEQEPAGLEQEDGGGAGRNRLRLVALAVVVTLALSYMVYAAFPGNALYYLSVSEFMDKQEAQDGRIVRVSGKLVEGSFHRQSTTTSSRFQIVDKDTVGAQSLEAAYVGVLPDLFFNPHTEIILQGSYGPSGVFQADIILVKCPSKFRSLEDEFRSSR